jgi:hypothetical protein
MSRDGFLASPLARWLLPAENAQYVKATHCCGDFIAPARTCLPSRCLEMGCITSLFYCCVLDCVYGAVAWQYIDQIRYNINEVSINSGLRI